MLGAPELPNASLASSKPSLSRMRADWRRWEGLPSGSSPFMMETRLRMDGSAALSLFEDNALDALKCIYGDVLRICIPLLVHGFNHMF